MPKTQEELKQIKQEVMQLSEKLSQLSDDDLKLVTGGNDGLQFMNFKNELHGMVDDIIRGYLNDRNHTEGK